MNWSLPNVLTTSNCELSAPASGTLPSIGAFSAQLNASKPLQFAPEQKVSRLEIKIGVAISDSTLTAATNITNNTTSTTVDSQGNIVITTIQTPGTTLPQAVPFLTLQVIDQFNSGNIISTQTAEY